MDRPVIAEIVRGHGPVQIVPPALVAVFGGPDHPLLSDETKPRTEEQGGVVEHGQELGLRHPLDGVHFLQMGFEGEGILGGDGDEEDVIDFVFSPRTGVSLS